MPRQPTAAEIARARAGPPDPLSPAQLAEAVALWRQVKHYERMDVHLIILSPGNPIRLRPVGHAIDLLVYGKIDITE